MRKMPTEIVSSVDTALRLIHILRDQGEVGVTEVATMLGISISSAHRLLATLVYRDFAERTIRRRYAPGPALELRPGAHSPVMALQEALRPTMRHLAQTLGETTSLGLLLGERVRIIATVEANRVLRVGDQEGTVLPAYKTAIGKAILAFMPEERALALIDRSTDPVSADDLARVTAELRGARNRGFAINHGEAETGVTAIGVPIFDSDGQVQAGLAVVMPSARFDHAAVEGQARVLANGAREARPSLGPTIPREIHL
jgi:IclR family transcriptional regulator, acetate operon repressor